jgi:hypothetical protein
MILEKTKDLVELSVLTEDCTFTFGARVNGQRYNEFWEQATTSFEQNNHRIDCEFHTLLVRIVLILR